MSPRNRLALALPLACALLGSSSAVAGETVSLQLKVVHAHKRGHVVDPRLKELAKELSKLSFTSYELKDEAAFKLEIGSAFRLQLPSKAWMVIRARGLDPDGKLRLDFEVEQIKFKTTAVIGRGATLAVGGPEYDGGALILALSWPTAGQ